MEKSWFYRLPLKVTEQVDFKLLLKDASVSVQQVASTADVLRRDLLKSLSRNPSKENVEQSGILRNLQAYTAIVIGAFDHSNQTLYKSVVTTWSDTLYATRERRTLNDIAFDLGNFFVNCSLWLAHRASYIIDPSICTTDEIMELNLKESHQLLRTAAGLLDYAIESIVPNLKTSPETASDLEELVLRRFRKQFLIETQELTLFRCLSKSYKFETTGSLAATTGRIFKELEQPMSPTEKWPINTNGDNIQNWRDYGLVKRHFWMAISRCCQAEYYLSNNDASRAIRCVDEAQRFKTLYLESVPKCRKNLGGIPDHAIEMVTNMVETVSEKVRKQNNMIHHQLPAIDIPPMFNESKLTMAEAIPFNEPRRHSVWDDVLPGNGPEKQKDTCSIM